MADTKVTGLTENTTPAATDIIYIVDDPGGTPASQKVTLANIKALVNDITTDAEWDAKGDIVAGTGANTADRLAVGANNTVLMADSTTGTGLKWSASPVVVDTVWDAAGDLIQGTGSNTASRLAIGTANQTLRVNAGATAAEWVSAGRVIITNTTTSGSQKAVTVNPLPTGYNSIEIEVLGRSDRASNVTDGVQCVLNNDTTTTNYRLVSNVVDTNSAPAAGNADAVGQIGAVPAASSVAGSAAVIWAKIMNPDGTTWRKQVFAQGGQRLDDTTNGEATNVYAFEWENTAAITRLDIQPAVGNWVDGSIVRVYGVY